VSVKIPWTQKKYKQPFTCKTVLDAEKKKKKNSESKARKAKNEVVEKRSKKCGNALPRKKRSGFDV